MTQPTSTRRRIWWGAIHACSCALAPTVVAVAVLIQAALS